MSYVKILIINTVGLDYEGITSIIYNYIHAMNRDQLDVHFVANYDTDEKLQRSFGELGTLDFLTNRKKNPKKYIAELRCLLKTKFDIVHIHGNSGTMLIEVALSKFYGAKKVFIHAHSTKTDHPYLNALLKYPMMLLADELIACSSAAGNWLYNKHRFIVMNNAVNLSKFQYCVTFRDKYRSEFGVNDAFLIGHIGNFLPPKNHFFLIDLFYEFHKLEPKSKLLLISDGPRFEQVKEKVSQLELQDSVIFAGRRSDIAGIYSAMDMFILPSNWEGLPLVMIEAQANGLPLLVSDVITRDAKCTDRVFYKPLSDGAERWAEHIRKIKNRNFDRTVDTHMDIAGKGFDIQREAENLRKIYLK